MIFRLVIALSLLAFSAAQAVSEPLASDWGETPQVALRLIAAPGVDGALRLGLQIRLKPEWKTYWRSPGDAGLPPEFDWSGSANLQTGTVGFPVPDRFAFAGLETFGYEGEVVLPIAVRVPDHAAAARARVLVDLLTCRSQCVPNRVTLALDLPAGPIASSPWTTLLAGAAAKVPGDSAPAGIAITRATASGDTLSVVLAANPPLARPDILVEGGDTVTFGAPQAAGSGRLSLPAAGVGGLVGHHLTLTVVDRAAPAAQPRAAAIDVVVEPE